MPAPPLSDAQARDLRVVLTESRDEGLLRRRQSIGLSLVGAASMAAVSLLQTGLVRHLPDPPLPGFDSDKVNTSEEAYQFGLPDGTLSLAGFAANVPLAAFGGADRWRTAPWVPLAFAAKSLVEAAGAAYYFYQMPAREKAWCGYCIVGAVASFGVFALSIPEARKALRGLLG
ncbi:MAG: vitamin K epoxide reductase family protein [Rhodothermales bacterium]|nr:vitamin K epoxide reductase family protein [Rhodothermales bacterium]